VIGIGCDLIPYAEGWKTPRRQGPGRFARNFLIKDPEWEATRDKFSSDPLLAPHFSIEKAGDLLLYARKAIERRSLGR
jgi:hypothetical protein